MNPEREVGLNMWRVAGAFGEHPDAQKLCEIERYERDLKAGFAKQQRCKQAGMAKALEMAGLPLVGQQHRGRAFRSEEGMKFRLETGVGSQTRGLCLTLLNDAGVACGMARSLFLPAPRGLFSSVAARPGHLTAHATVWTDDGRELVIEGGFNSESQHAS